MLLRNHGIKNCFHQIIKNNNALDVYKLSILQDQINTSRDTFIFVLFTEQNESYRQYLRLFLFLFITF